MIFNSFEFALFFPAVLLAVRLTRGRARPRRLVLLAASYLFYGWWDWRFLGLIIASTLVDFVVAQRIDASDDERRRRNLLLTSLAVNLGILAVFKYFGFFIDSLTDLAAGLGVTLDAPTVNIILPVGISFYTFQTISYTFDVYRGRTPAERSLDTFALYVAFFPQLVAGPIERSHHLLPQIREPRSVTWDDTKSAILLIASGLVKKVVLADGIAAVVDARFTDPSGRPVVALWVGVLAFTIQIYGDFSGYSSVARGVSRLLGVDLMRNFEQPYFSRNITEFWRRWHISLSTWLRDYLYVPLGGNRRGKRRTHVNLMITMFLGGLWHGAAWTFVFWGLAHGVLLAAHRATMDADESTPAGRLRTALSMAATFVTVSVIWVLFRATSFDNAMAYLGGMFDPSRLSVPRLNGDLTLTLFLFAVMLAIDAVDRNRDRLADLLARPVVVGASVGAAAAALIVWSGGVSRPFIYFQF